MSLLHLIKKHQAVRLAANAIGELTLLIVSDVAWRTANELGHRMSFHELTHVQANHGFFLSKVCCSKCLAQLCLANACRATEDERSNRSIWVLEASASSTHSLGDSCHGLILPDDTVVKGILQLDKAGRFVGGDLLNRNTSPLRDNCSYVVLGDNDLRAAFTIFRLLASIGLQPFLSLLCSSCLNLLDLVQQRGFPCLHLCGFLIVLVSNRILFVGLHLLELISGRRCFLWQDG
mmetsp:Transcript_18269/g.42587  ORF Transcript_18269/g.42587 Transcript_18269/m.42587 type:complete len:234 (+) Transcript_18269:702-1403(+)